MEDPGAANGMIHLIEPFKQHDFNIDAFVTGHAKEFLAQRKIQAHSIETTDVTELQHFCQRYDAVFIGNSENRKSLSFNILDISKKLSITSFCFVDSSVNHKYRFAGLTSNPLQHKPDYIFVPDEYCKKLYLELGFKEKSIFPLGHPFYENVARERSRLKKLSARSKRIELFGEENFSKKIIVFLGETLAGFDRQRDVYQEHWTLGKECHSKYKIHIALESLIKALQKYDKDNLHLVLRLHPKNQTSDFKPYLSFFDQTSQNSDPLDLIYFADIIIGVETSLMTEAAILGKKTLSIVPNSSLTSAIPHSILEKIALAKTDKKLSEHLERLVKTNECINPEPYQFKNIAYNMANTVKEILETKLAFS